MSLRVSYCPLNQHCRFIVWLHRHGDDLLQCNGMVEEDAELVSSISCVDQVSLGEMVAFLPIPGGHIKLAERFVDPAFSFTLGWNYW